MSNKTNRRLFLKIAGFSAFAFSLNRCTQAEKAVMPPAQPDQTRPLIISTWRHGLDANSVGYPLLRQGASALDAVEKAVMVVENDPSNKTVGIGGFPDRDGVVTLDACIMQGDGRCGAVAFLQDFKNPIAVARKVMEETPHVMLVGQGAYQFAKAQGFEPENLLTESTRKEYEKWLTTAKYEPVVNIENHDTIGTLAIDKNGNLAGACTTSGAAWKMHGRVGDSPIIGAGLFVDQEVGAACATGLGEAVVRTAGSAMVVEAMRHGMSPQEACKEVVARIQRKHPSVDNLQVGFLALDKHGNYGGYSLRKGFDFAVATGRTNELVDATYAIDE